MRKVCPEWRMRSLIINNLLFGGHREVYGELLRRDGFNAGNRICDTRSIEHVALGQGGK
jgi:hypothetical protein